MLHRLDFKKLTTGRFSVILLILFVASLYAVLTKGVLPFVEHVAKSDLFLEDSGAMDSQDHSKMALLQCNDFVRRELGDSKTVEFAATDFKSWELSEGRYLVSSRVVAQNDAGQPLTRNFACNVQFTGGDETDQDNWTLHGLDLQEI